MPRIEPLSAIRFDSPSADLASHLAPPYDVVPEALRVSLAGQTRNTVHLTLPQGETRYADAAAVLAAWRADGTLTAAGSALYLYEQTATVHGEPITVRGLLAAVAVDDVLPHERVYDKIVTDRFDLLQATDTELEPIVAIYDGTNGATKTRLDDIQATPPDVEVVTAFDGDRHRLWSIIEPEVVKDIVTDLAWRNTVIADGHHRWTTARKHAAALGRTDATQLMLLQDIRTQAPALLAIHRTLRGVSLEAIRTALAPYFDIDDLTSGDADSWASDLQNEQQTAFVFFGREGAFHAAIARELSPLLPADMHSIVRRLDAAILHGAVFDGLLGKIEPGFVHTPGEAQEVVDAEDAIGVLLRPTPQTAVLAVADAGELMPRKSTFFLPKPVSGLLFRPLS